MPITEEKFIAVGIHMARKLFSKRSRPGRKNVEVHLSEAELAAAPPKRPRYTWYIGTECQECGAQDQDTTLPACPKCGWTHQNQTDFEKKLRANLPARRR